MSSTTARRSAQRARHGKKGMPRLLDLFARESIPATFLPPATWPGAFPASSERIVGEGHELRLPRWRYPQALLSHCCQMKPSARLRQPLQRCVAPVRWVSFRPQPRYCRGLSAARLRGLPGHPSRGRHKLGSYFVKPDQRGAGRIPASIRHRRCAPRTDPRPLVPASATQPGGAVLPPLGIVDQRTSRCALTSSDGANGPVGTGRHWLPLQAPRRQFQHASARDPGGLAGCCLFRSPIPPSPQPQLQVPRPDVAGVPWLPAAPTRLTGSEGRRADAAGGRSPVRTGRLLPGAVDLPFPGGAASTGRWRCTLAWCWRCCPFSPASRFAVAGEFHLWPIAGGPEAVRRRHCAAAAVAQGGDAGVLLRWPTGGAPRKRIVLLSARRLGLHRADVFALCAAEPGRRQRRLFFLKSSSGCLGELAGPGPDRNGGGGFLSLPAGLPWVLACRRCRSSC